MITSRDNEKLKLVRKLHERRWRDKLGLFAAEGEDLVDAARAAGIEPALARSAFGEVGSAQPSDSATAAPNASAVRISVPMFPGSRSRQRASVTARSSQVGRSSRRYTAITRGGWPAVATSASSFGSTSSPARSRSTGGAVAAATASSPSTKKRPSLSRQRRSCSLRTSLRRSLSRETVTAHY